MSQEDSGSNNSDFHNDDKIMDELKSQNIKGFTERGKLAINELAHQHQGEVIFLILSLNSRLRELEEALARVDNEITNEARH